MFIDVIFHCWQRRYAYDPTDCEHGTLSTYSTPITLYNRRLVINPCAECPNADVLSAPAGRERKAKLCHVGVRVRRRLIDVLQLASYRGF